MSIIVHQALLAAEKHNIENFKASNGWLQNFLRRNSIKPSRRLHGKAGDIDPISVSNRMEELRTIMTNFEPKNI